MLGITYHYRPSAAARVRRSDAFTLDDAAVALACMAFPLLTAAEADSNQRLGKKVKHAVEMTVIAKKEVGRLWDQDSDLYGAVFPKELSAIRLWRIVQLFRFIDSVLAATEASETPYQRRMFFRHGRHFVMTFVARQSADIINKPATQIDQTDQRTISTRINTLAELIYAESASLNATKGYLAIFRNLTDSQPLADRVLARLKAEDDAAALAAKPAAAGATEGAKT